MNGAGIWAVRPLLGGRAEPFATTLGSLDALHLASGLDEYTIPVETMNLDDTGMANALETAGKKK